MRYAQIRKMDVSNGEGIGIALFTQGCPFHCKNCFNPETWDFDGGNLFTKKEFNEIIDLIKKDYIKRITILGGEPLVDQNVEDLCELISYIKKHYPDKKIWLYSGNTFEKLWERPIDSYSRYYREILLNIDILIDGPYIDELRDYKLKFRGSSNQRVIDMKKTLEEGETVLYIK